MHNEREKVHAKKKSTTTKGDDNFNLHKSSIDIKYNTVATRGSQRPAFYIRQRPAQSLGCASQEVHFNLMLLGVSEHREHEIPAAGVVRATLGRALMDKFSSLGVVLPVW